MIRERARSAVSGLLMLLLLLFVMGAAAFGVFQTLPHGRVGPGLAFVFVELLAVVMAAGLFMVNPNEGRVLQLFGAYRGTVKDPGLRWANPFYSKKAISLRVRNFETGRLKVNDTDGNPVDIAAVVVWRVVDTAEASFEVDNYEHYVHVQSEAALRNLATRYPYDSHDDTQVSLRGNTAAVARDLKEEIQDRLAKAGVEVVEARISHLAYAAEIAAAMLRRQQAGAIVAARARIVEGAVGMVEMALALLEKSTQVRLDDDRKAAMVSNLLVVLCADREAQPVVNTGTIHQ